MKIRIKNLELRIKLFNALFFILTALFYPKSVHAVCHTGGNVNIGNCFGFGDIKSLGEATSKLVLPAFEVTAAIVIIYFLIGAFFYLKAGGDKEQLEKARNMINHAIVGFLILIVAFFILDFLLQSFGVGLSLF